MRKLRQRAGIISVTIQWKRWQVDRDKYFPDFYAHEEELGGVTVGRVPFVYGNGQGHDS